MTVSDVVEPSVLGDGPDAPRIAVIAGLRELADFLAAHPQIPTPDFPPSVQIYGLDKDQLVAAVKAGGAKWRKLFFGKCFELRTEFSGGVVLGLNSDREQVCQKVVTGTETVTVPAVEASPERVEEREVIEWVCEPLLG